MNKLLAAAAVLALAVSCSPEKHEDAPKESQAPSLPDAVIADPARNEKNPASNRQLLIPSEGMGMNALMLRAAGAGPHPTMLLLHGLPGNEQNLDLAQAVRRAGWNVLTLHYRGSWGSPGNFSIAGAIADAEAAMDFLRQDDNARSYGVDPQRLVIAGHSMGGLAAALQAAGDPRVAGLVLIDAWDAGATAAALAEGGDAAREAFQKGLDDLGNSLKGANVESLTDELLDHQSEWSLMPVAPELARVPMLSIYATHGGAAENKALAEAVGKAAGASVKAVELASDHSFADKRIALAAEVVRWLDALPKTAAGAAPVPAQ
ncbi:alpha/beta hydrolase [Sphingosinicella rhizophila]|uniref:Alpha/beta fold hydrolase n=1 Tax=Sphingosinicella rhizophila TaxID=3050082 RepID=A0ABU3Q776_9SPHN|nr:alpha/beta fold hydrolase [Sphingosinicella sp. GR2756]MDT9599256.1 alpha/beta fold hydrolase [Sphingosinicella sp. GR2756]